MRAPRSVLSYCGSEAALSARVAGEIAFVPLARVRQKTRAANSENHAFPLRRDRARPEHSVV